MVVMTFAVLDGDILAHLEREAIERVLTECRGNITHAAKRLGIYRQTLQRKLRKLGCAPFEVR